MLYQRLVLSLVIGLAGARVLQAQVDDKQQPFAGVQRSPVAVSPAGATQSCPPVIDAAARANLWPDQQPLSVRCRFSASKQLGAADGVHWATATYQTTQINPTDSTERANGGNAMDTTVSAISVLYSIRSTDGQWLAEWIGRVDQEDISSIAPTIGARPDGSMLVAVQYCFNGTGGCWQEFIRRNRGRWSEVVQVYGATLPPIPHGRIGKGVGINVKTLRGSFGVYSAGDANCCPSRELLVTLDQRGDSVVLKSSRVRQMP